MSNNEEIILLQLIDEETIVEYLKDKDYIINNNITDISDILLTKQNLPYLTPNEEYILLNFIKRIPYLNSDTILTLENIK